MPKALPVIDMSRPVCCSPVAVTPADDATALHIALRLKALADPARVKLISLLLNGTPGPNTTGALAAAVNLSEPTVSHHLSQLRNAGLIESQRDGAYVVHAPRREALAALCVALDPGCCR